MKNPISWSETEDQQGPEEEARIIGRAIPAGSAATGSSVGWDKAGFGRVYLAQDDDLDRPVAIKVPNPERIAGPGDVEAYLGEARAWRSSTTPTSSRSTTWGGPTTDYATWSPSTWRGATWRSG